MRRTPVCVTMILNSLSLRLLCVAFALLVPAHSAIAAAIAPDAIRDLAFGESDVRGKAIGAIASRGDAESLSPRARYCDRCAQAGVARARSPRCGGARAPKRRGRGNVAGHFRGARQG